jgi:hypothetical protein
MLRPQRPLLVPRAGVDHCRTPRVIRVEGLEPAIEQDLIRILLRLQTRQRLDIPLIQSVVNTPYEYLAEMRTPYLPVVAAHT